MKATIGRRDYTLNLPFGLDVLEDAAEAIDRAQDETVAFKAAVEAARASGNEATARVPASIEIRLMKANAEIIWHGIETATPGTITREAFFASLAFSDRLPLMRYVGEALNRSGLIEAGETAGDEAAKAPANPSRRKSGASSRRSR